MLETYILSLTLPPSSHLCELTTVRAVLGWGRGGKGLCIGTAGERGRCLRSGGRDVRAHQLYIKKPSSSEWTTSFLQRVLFSPPPNMHTPTSKQNSALHFLSNRRAPTLEVESKGRKAITSVLVIKRICIMNHMPKGPVLHVGQIFVWIFNFYIQMKHSAQSTNGVR